MLRRARPIYGLNERRIKSLALKKKKKKTNATNKAER